MCECCKPSQKLCTVILLNRIIFVSDYSPCNIYPLTMKQCKNILLVEDDEDDQYFFTDAVSRIENAVLQGIAINGEDALEKLNSDTQLPDIIFMDINMPRMNGIECLTEIIGNPKLKDIPVIMLTSSNEEMEEARTIGAKAFMKKPNQLLDLQMGIQKMINLDFATQGEIAGHTFDRPMM